MFSNLIESDSHIREFKRRSSFFLVTVAAYALILFAAGIIGVLTYDARVEAPTANLTLLDWIPPVKPITPDVARPNQPERPRAISNAPVDRHITTPERIERISPIDDLRVAPPEIGITAPSTPPVEGPLNITGRNADPPTSSNQNEGCASCTGANTTTSQPTPEPTPVRTPPVQRVASSVLVSKVVNLPKPSYPLIAKQIHAQGPVNVQILVDEEGKVISAHAVSGNPALIHAAEDAARRARFTPTMLNNQPVKVSGVITYNFVLQ